MTIYAFEPSGYIKKPTAAELEAADKEGPIITLNRMTLIDGRPYYAYLAVKPSSYQEFYEATCAGEIMLLHEYGTILADGFTEEPPPEVVEEMRALFGCDPDCKEKLLQEVKKQQDAFMAKKEEKRIAGIVDMLKKQTADSAN